MGQLENCDPNVNAECKRSLEDVSEQLAIQLAKSNPKDSNTVSSYSETEHGSSASTLKSNTAKIVEQRNLSGKLSAKETNSKNVNARESAGSKDGKKPAKRHHRNEKDDIPDVYFLSK